MFCHDCHDTGIWNGQPCRCAFGEALRLKSQLTLADEILDEISEADTLEATTGIATGVMIRCPGMTHLQQHTPRVLMTPPYASHDKILDAAHAAGWEYLDGTWFCPDCATKLAHGEAIVSVVTQ